MKEATPEELRERYRNLPVEELLILAADASQLTLGASQALHQVLRERKLSQRDVAETRASVHQWRAEENQRITGGPCRFYWQLIWTVHFLVLGFIWLFWGAVANLVCNSPESAARFQKVAFVICFVGYAYWQVGNAIRKWRRKKSLDKPIPLSAGADSAPPEKLNHN